MRGHVRKCLQIVRSRVNGNIDYADFIMTIILISQSPQSPWIVIISVSEENRGFGWLFKV